MALRDLLRPRPIKAISVQNAPGWCDSFQISPDGLRFYMMYTTFPIWTFLSTNPLKVSWGYPGHIGAVSTSAHRDICIYELTLSGVGGSFTSVTCMPFNRSDVGYASLHMEGAVGSRKVYYIANDGVDPFTKIECRQETAGVWGEPLLAEMATLNVWGHDAGAYIDNPTVNLAQDVMIMSSTKPPLTGTKDLYVSQKVTGVWQNPVNMGATVNGAGVTNDQPFIAPNGTGNTYWTRGVDIYHGVLAGTVLGSVGVCSFGGPVLPGNPGEFTVTSDGSRCYFTRFDLNTEEEYLYTATNAGTAKTWNEPSLVELPWL